MNRALNVLDRYLPYTPSLFDSWCCKRFIGSAFQSNTGMLPIHTKSVPVEVADILIIVERYHTSILRAHNNIRKKSSDLPKKKHFKSLLRLSTIQLYLMVLYKRFWYFKLCHFLASPIMNQRLWHFYMRLQFTNPQLYDAKELCVETSQCQPEV